MKNTQEIVAVWRQNEVGVGMTLQAALAAVGQNQIDDSGELILGQDCFPVYPGSDISDRSVNLSDGVAMGDFIAWCDEHQVTFLVLTICHAVNTNNCPKGQKEIY